MKPVIIFSAREIADWVCNDNIHPLWKRFSRKKQGNIVSLLSKTRRDVVYLITLR